MGSIRVNLDILGARTMLEIGPDADFRWLFLKIEEIVRQDEGILYRDAQIITIKVDLKITFFIFL